MKHIFLVAVIIGLAILTRAQSECEILGEGNGKILKGLISRDMLEKDTAFRWFSSGTDIYTPSAEQVEAFKAKKEDLQFVVFAGTWNEDTRHLLPRFYSLTDAAGLSRDQVTLVGVDRNKRTVNDLTEKMHISQIPTIIVLQNDRELGRITGSASQQWEKKLTDLLESNTKQ